MDGRRWSREDTAILRNEYLEGDVEEIAQTLQRLVEAVKSRAWLIGIKKPHRRHFGFYVIDGEVE